jgi:hypothetical protein
MTGGYRLGKAFQGVDSWSERRAGARSAPTFGSGGRSQAGLWEGESSAHEDLLDLRQGGVFGEPFPLRGILGTQRGVDVRVGDGEEFLGEGSVLEDRLRWRGIWGWRTEKAGGRRTIRSELSAVWRDAKWLALGL